MIAQSIELFLSNFSLSMLILALFICLIHRMRSSLPTAEIVYRWIALIAVGFSGIYAFILHAFFPEVSASTVGWAPSPFQYEVAVADLTIGVLAVMSFKASLGFRAATVIATMLWLWGDALGHIYQMITHLNFAPGNAGSWFWMAVVTPIILSIAFLKLR